MKMLIFFLNCVAMVCSSVLNLRMSSQTYWSRPLWATTLCPLFEGNPDEACIQDSLRE